MAQALGRWRASDAVGVRCGPVRARDQEPEPEQEPEGELLCRLMEGRGGDWMGHDARGRIVRVKRAKDGALEIRHMAEPAGDEADPNVVGYAPGKGGDPARAATGDALSAWQRTQDPTKH